VSHNVAPVKMALGAGGCVDCHSRDGKFFSRTYLVDPYDAVGQAVFEPVYHTIGLGTAEINRTVIAQRGLGLPR